MKNNSKTCKYNLIFMLEIPLDYHIFDPDGGGKWLQRILRISC